MSKVIKQIFGRVFEPQTWNVTANNLAKHVLRADHSQLKDKIIVLVWLQNKAGLTVTNFHSVYRWI